MTPKERAHQLLNIMFNQTYTFQEYAGANMSTEIVGYEAGKKCAMAAVDEILKVVNDIWMDSFTTGESNNKFYNYWQEVKQELEKL